MQPQLELRPVQTAATHPRPNLAAVSPVLRGDYSPSRDGVDANLVILLHGLGDTSTPFARLGQQLNLPQTAVLSLQAPERVPLLEEEAYQWWDSFDALGEIIPNPNPSATLHLLKKLLAYLTAPTSPSASASPASKPAAAPAGCGWHPSQLHLFGYAQGGSCAGELALAWAREHPVASSSLPSSSTSTSPVPHRTDAHLGSLVAISAPLLSHPTPSPVTRARTRALVVVRKPEERSVGVQSWEKGFEGVRVARLEGGRGREGMPRGMDEWREIMRFWSEVLVRKSALELSGEVYEISGGTAPSQALGAYEHLHEHEHDLEQSVRTVSRARPLAASSLPLPTERATGSISAMSPPEHGEQQQQEQQQDQHSAALQRPAFPAHAASAPALDSAQHHPLAAPLGNSALAAQTHAHAAHADWTATSVPLEHHAGTRAGTPDAPFAAPPPPLQHHHQPSQPLRQLPPGAAYAPARQPDLPKLQMPHAPYSHAHPWQMQPTPPASHEPATPSQHWTASAPLTASATNYSRPLPNSAATPPSATFAQTPHQQPPRPPSLHQRRSFIAPSPASPPSSTLPLPTSSSSPSSSRARTPSSTRAAAALAADRAASIPSFVPAAAFSPEDRGPYPPSQASPIRERAPPLALDADPAGAGAQGRPASLAFDPPPLAPAAAAAVGGAADGDMAGVGRHTLVRASGGGGALPPASVAGPSSSAPAVTSPSRGGGAPPPASALAAAKSPQLVQPSAQALQAAAVSSAAQLSSLPFPSAPGPTAPQQPQPQQQLPPHLTPQPEICVECMMRDRDMADVDVSTPGVWDRASDADWDEQCRWEAEHPQPHPHTPSAEGAEGASAESAGGGGARRAGVARDSSSAGCYSAGMGAGAGVGAEGARRRFGKGQLLTSGNLKVWTTMNPPATAHRWKTLQVYLATQAHFLELDRQAREAAGGVPYSMPPPHPLERDSLVASRPLDARLSTVTARDRSSSLLSPTALAAEKAALEQEERALRATKSRSSRATLADETNRHSSASLFPPGSSSIAPPQPPFAASPSMGVASSGSSMRSYSAGDQPWLANPLRRMSSANQPYPTVSSSPPKSPAASTASMRFAFPKFARSTTDLRSIHGGNGGGASPRSASPARLSGIDADGRRTSMWSRFRQSASASVLSFAPSGSMMDMHLGLSQDKHMHHHMPYGVGTASHGGAHYGPGGGFGGAHGGAQAYETYAAMSDPAVARHADRRERDRVLAASQAAERAAAAGSPGETGGKKKKKGLKGFFNKLVGGKKERVTSNSAPATPGAEEVPFDASFADDDELAPPPPLSALANEPRYHQRSASNSSIDSFGPYTPPLPASQHFRASYTAPVNAAADRQSIMTMGSYASSRSKQAPNGGVYGAGRPPTIASGNSYSRPSFDSLRDQAGAGSFARPGSPEQGGAAVDGGEPEVLVAGDDCGDATPPAQSFAAHNIPPPHVQPRLQKSLPLLPSEAMQRPPSFPPPTHPHGADPYVASGPNGFVHPSATNMPYSAAAGQYGASRSAFSLHGAALGSQTNFPDEFGFDPRAAGDLRNATITGSGSGVGAGQTVRKSRSRSKVFSMHFGGFGKKSASKHSPGSSPEVPPLPSPAAGMRGASLDSASLVGNRFGPYEARYPAEGLVAMR
ncbi:alpha/beta hydrolase [Rhodotorula paludigena]|uniref:alpha/beta hydrolase n=1 Tax=Rhodotorula paludigena TaxID=86838 RepID=UPI003175F7C0